MEPPDGLFVQLVYYYCLVIITKCFCLYSHRFIYIWVISLQLKHVTDKNKNNTFIVDPNTNKIQLKKICIYKTQKKTNNYTIQSDQYTNDWGRWIILRHKCRYHRIQQFNLLSVIHIYTGIIRLNMRYRVSQTCTNAEY